MKRAAALAETDNVREPAKARAAVRNCAGCLPEHAVVVKSGGGIRNWREFLAAAEVCPADAGHQPERLGGSANGNG